jgi:hypothetical protein
VRRANAPQNARGRQLVRIAPTWDDDRIGTVEQPERIAHENPDAAGRANRLSLRGAHFESIPRHTELRAREREQLGCAPELECAKAVVRECCDQVLGLLCHGAILPFEVVRVSALSAAGRIDGPGRSVCSQEGEP